MGEKLNFAPQLPLFCHMLRLGSLTHAPRPELLQHFARQLKETTITTAITPPASQPPRRAKSRVLVLAGPTSVGKSSTALSLCSTLDGEVISADSVQLYRYLDIGSNKASKQEQAEVSHHLLDIIDPDIEYSAGDFFRAARDVTADVVARSKVPVVVGGTMMYVRWYVNGRPATPRAGPESRREANHLIADAQARNDWDGALAILATRDPVRASRLNRNDWYRLVRALEVYHASGGISMTEMPVIGGAPQSELHNVNNKEGGCLHAGEREEDGQSDDMFDFRCVFLYPEDRIEMNRRIDRRCEHMILPTTTALTEDEEDTDRKQKGDDVTWHGNWEKISSILSEVTQLLVSRKLRVAPATPCLAIGYRQTIAYLLQRAQNQSVPQEEIVGFFRSYVENFQQATRHYAKQQMSWFRKEAKFRWISADDEAVASIAEIMAMSREEYDVMFSNELGLQQEIKDGIIAQGRTMKRYISRRTLLVPDSDEESMAVALGEDCAADISRHIDEDEIKRMLGVVANASTNCS